MYLQKIISVVVLLIILSPGSTSYADTQDVTAPSKPAEIIRQLRGGKAIRINGESMELGGGTVNSWVITGRNGFKMTGVTLTGGALDIESLPIEITQYDAHIDYPKLPLSPFNHAYITWKPYGHGPDTLYESPHFDFHFAFVTPEFMSSITSDGIDGQIIPDEGFMPSTSVPQYASDGSYYSVTGQGVHWHQSSAPEWNGGEFTETFMWGSYKGKNLFLEPMITLETLLARRYFKTNIDTPRCYEKTGYYPTQYGWYHKYTKHGELAIDVYVSGFEYHEEVSKAECLQLDSLN